MKTQFTKQHPPFFITLNTFCFVKRQVGKNFAQAQAILKEDLLWGS